MEGIAYRNGRIIEERMRKIAKPMLKNQYGQYLMKVIDEIKEDVTLLSFTHKEMRGPKEQYQQMVEDKIIGNTVFDYPLTINFVT